MTGVLDDRQFSRTTFLRGGGALIVGFSFAGLAGKAQAASAPDSHSGTVPGPPDASQIDSWIVIHSDNTASIYHGKVNITGSPFSLLMIAAEELDMTYAQMRAVTPDTNTVVNQGATTGSNGVAGGGPQVRAAAAAAKQVLLGLAAAQLGVAASQLSVTGGVVSGGGKSVTYGDLLGDKLFNATITTPAAGIDQGVFPAKSHTQYKVVGQRIPRSDIPAKISGTYTYVQNLRVPGMVHGRVIRPRGQAAYGTGQTPVSIDESSIKHLKDVQIVRKGDFLGVVAPVEYVAIQAASQLKVKWSEPATNLPSSGNVFNALRNQETTTTTLVDTGNVAAGFAGAAKVLEATYHWPWHIQAAIGPHAAVADVKAESAMVFAATQNPYGLRNTLAVTLGLPVQSIRVQYYEGSSNYGNSPWDDTAHAAAILSQAAGKPVRLQFMRWDEHGWANGANAQLFDVRGAVDAQGKIVAYDFTSFQPDWVISAASAELAGTATGAATPFLFNFGNENPTSGGGNYAIANRRVSSKPVSIKEGWPRSSYMRAPGANSALFASEQMIDELAHASVMDPLAFRRQNITEPRWLAVLDAVASASKWQARPSASKLSSAGVVSGRGLAIGGYVGTRAAVVADIEVNRKTGKITVKHLCGAQDCGLAVNPASVENQMTGGMIQMASRTLFENYKFSTKRVSSLDWVTYPIMRFKEAPTVTTVVVQRTDLRATGSGEPTSAPVGAAIANAFFDATGVRVRSLPLTPARVRAVLGAAS